MKLHRIQRLDQPCHRPFPRTADASSQHEDRRGRFATAFDLLHAGFLYALSLCIGAAGFAAELESADSASAVESRPCVLLSNDNVIFGVAKQVGSKVEIRQDAGAALTVPYQNVKCWADSIEQIYQYRVAHRRGDRVETRLADARWCLRYGLWHHALMALAEIDRFDPGNRQVAVLRQQIRRLRATQNSETQDIAQAVAASDSQTPPDGAGGDPEIRPVAYHTDDPIAAPGRRSASRRHNEEQIQFTRRIQPLLINRCGGCHSHTGDLAWKMVVPGGGRRPSTDGTRRNLDGLLALLDRTGGASFIELATTAHGGAGQPPIKSSEKALVDSLREWIRDRPTPETDSGASDGAPDEVTGRDDWQAKESTTEFTSEVSSDQPSRLPPVGDPFDPDRFNRLYHRGE
ncbi:hypothetical protein [Crateriforma conspicua]|uniref:Cytochrome c domain-containing protein n=1 Tax=Crateriforma conspicua TaxID=2527996 RepID=A0A5C5Y9Y8_9PLAN|nr:hypothetical protein [Crateriforma conspicua]TWT71944.1 hypothetical protein Pan14r_42610 [Crateriforma conspicua]